MSRPGSVPISDVSQLSLCDLLQRRAVHRIGGCRLPAVDWNSFCGYEARREAGGRDPTNKTKCGICLHPERGRIDFLVCSGAGVEPTSKKSGVSYDSLRNHVAKYISQS